MSRQRVLVFAPGVIPSDKPVQYYLPEHPKIKEGARLAPIALIKLQETLCDKRRPDRVIALCTKKVMEERLPSLKAEFRELGIDLQEWKIADGKTAAEIRSIVRELLLNVPDECDLILDVTHGFRSAQIVFCIAAQYLSFLRPSVHIEGLYYGMMSTNKNGPPEPAPLINLNLFIELMNWAYAVRVYRDTYLPQKLADTLKGTEDSSGQTAAIERSLSRFSDALDLGLPIEMAERAVELGSLLAEPMSSVLAEKALLPDELFGLVGGFASQFASESGDAVPDELDESEIRRQANIIDRFLEVGRTAHAIGMMREWAVLMVTYHNGDRSSWRTRKQRRNAEKMIWKANSLKLWLSPEIGDAVKAIWGFRNALHHHGHESGGSLDTDQILTQARQAWDCLKSTIGQEAKWKMAPQSADGQQEAEQ
ncbi:MAG: TM1812 family CRISPR-associated protein [Clostridia bacterium]|nr:TM1812 family CRISPR-associated protein [Clostridia bacterium]